MIAFKCSPKIEKNAIFKRNRTKLGNRKSVKTSVLCVYVLKASLVLATPSVLTSCKSLPPPLPVGNDKSPELGNPKEISLDLDIKNFLDVLPRFNRNRLPYKYPPIPIPVNYRYNIIDLQGYPTLLVKRIPGENFNSEIPNSDLEIIVQWAFTKGPNKGKQVIFFLRSNWVRIQTDIDFANAYDPYLLTMVQEIEQFILIPIEHYNWPAIKKNDKEGNESYEPNPDIPKIFIKIKESLQDIRGQLEALQSKKEYPHP